MSPESIGTSHVTPSDERQRAVQDYRIAYRSRQASLLGRREVLTGKAKFGIFGDGKEVPQLAMAQVFRAGDFRSGYYRDQTFMMAAGLLTLDQFFAQLYSHASLEAEPSSAGRQMNAHFATRSLDSEGGWRDLTAQGNSAADLSPTASQMPRLVGLALASKLYRQLPELESSLFSEQGNEVAFGTIGNASCAQGMFWEAVNAICLLQVPVVLSIWDDGYGISVPNEFQLAKGHLGAILAGFQRRSDDSQGCELLEVEGWNYPALCAAYRGAADLARREHIPVLLHITELTQPQGHSSSGSHERYKTEERLAWEEELDCIRQMRRWLLQSGLTTEEELDADETEDRRLVSEAKDRAWRAFREEIEAEAQELRLLMGEKAAAGDPDGRLAGILQRLERSPNPLRKDLLAAARAAQITAGGEAGKELGEWYRRHRDENRERYGTELHSDTVHSALRVDPVAPIYGQQPEKAKGYEILNAGFEDIFRRRPEVFAFGEDVGALGDVNQGMAGLQDVFGPERITDTGIRECTIVGQAIGLAMRGLRPIAEIQYLDYVLYALQLLSDDLASLRHRTRAGQMAPVVVRTRGHRLEGIWHSGSPMAGILNLVRGIYVCVPRDMTRAIGFYNTLLEGDDPGLVVEVLNAYRLKEPMPSNLPEVRMPLGIPEVVREGSDVSIVTYGACVCIAEAAARQLAEAGIEAEILDVQTLLPFDREGRILESLQKTSRILFLDEDVPGGTTAFMMQQVLERQGGFWWLEVAPRTLTSQPHRPPYGSDGDYACKPNREDVFEAVYEMMREVAPRRFPTLF